jgi:alkyl sulfatase BDS1-like metallo-beta-lactamase superfamily hydrolase
MDIVELADRMWRGERATSAGHPLSAIDGIAEITGGVAFLPTFGNCSIFATDDGLFMVDTGSAMMAEKMHAEIRRWSTDRLNCVVYSHGHIDHVGGVDVFEREARERGWPTVRVVAQENVVARFDRYIATAGYNQVVNRRQFGAKDLVWPTSYRYPDETYVDELLMRVGSLEVELRHEKGETDDATVTWIDSKKVLCAGDMFIWTSPNAGNPQKVQRYPSEWAEGLRRMAKLDAEVLLPGHGLPIFGNDRITLALEETAAYLESIVEQTLSMMNDGMRLGDIVSSVEPPSHLTDRPYLRAMYDEPEFIVHNIWRLYGGWWDGNPATLKPANDRAIASEIAGLAGGPGRLADRAEALVAQGSPEAVRLAGHLVEMAWLAAPQDPAIQAARQRIFTARAQISTSTMAKGVFRWAARESTGQEV